MSDTLNQTQDPSTCCGNGCDISARRAQDSSAEAGARRSTSGECPCGPDCPCGSGCACPPASTCCN